MKFETLNVNDECESAPQSKDGFWKRQFSDEPTKKQRVYDWFFGVILPVICVAADPIIFRSSVGIEKSFFGTFRPFAYLLSAASIMAMVAWLLWGDRLRGVAAPIAGLFFLGSGISLAVGLVIFPLSMLGLIFVIGALGFTPFISGLVYLRNAVRAYRSAKLSFDTDLVWRAAILGGMFSLVVPYVINFEIYRMTERLTFGRDEVIQHEATKLSWMAPLVDPYPIWRKYYDVDPADVDRRRSLSMAYKKLTGEHVDSDDPRQF